LFVVGALIGGVLVGAALGGSLTRLERLGLRDLRLVVVAIVIQAIGSLALTGTAYVIAMVASLALATAFVVRNPQLPGRALIVGGLALNALVILVNGSMPVAASAARDAGVDLSSIRDDPRHSVMGAHTHLSWLADRIPLALPWQPQVLSVGDVLVAAGVGLLVAVGMLRGTARPPAIPVRKAPSELERLLR
jgi:hypothetical protein